MLLHFLNFHINQKNLIIYEHKISLPKMITYKLLIKSHRKNTYCCPLKRHRMKPSHLRDDESVS